MVISDLKGAMSLYFRPHFDVFEQFNLQTVIGYDGIWALHVLLTKRSILELKVKLIWSNQLILAGDRVGVRDRGALAGTHAGVGPQAGFQFL